MSLWSSLQKDYSEHAPLSTQDDDDDEEEPPLPPYSDNPDTPIRSPYSDTPQDIGNGAAAVRRSNGRSSNGDGATPASAHKAMAVNGDDDDEDEDPGFGEGDFYRSPNNGSHRYSSTPSKQRRNNKPTRYRTGLVCAYLKHWMTCCGAFGGGRTKRFVMCLFYLVLFGTIMFCASSIGYIIARDGSKSVVADGGGQNNSDSGNNNAGSGYGVPSIDNGGGKTFDKQTNAANFHHLHSTCTKFNSCWEEQAEECATYRAACMALELHSDDESSGGSALETPGGSIIVQIVAESWRGSGHAVAPSSSTTSSSSGGTTTSNQNPAIANEVMKKCNAANLNPPSECIEACRQGACCYVSSSYLPIEQIFESYYGAGAKNPMQTAVTCASSVGFCQQYGSCEHLNHMKDVAGWNSDEFNYVVDVSTPCKAEHIAQFGALQCSNVCQPAHCCFSGEYACDDVQLGHLNCEDYKACQVLYPNKKASTKELLELAERIDKVCSASSLNTIGGRAECQDVCSDHLCCFYQDGCANDPDKNCLAYAGSDGGQVNTNNSNNNNNAGNAGSSTSPDVAVEEFAAALDEACSEDNLETIGGIYKCHNKCQSHLCCFVSDDDQFKQDCSNQRPAACNVYEPCKRLVNPIHGNEPVKTLDSADIEKIVFDACYFGADPLKITGEMRLCCFSDYLLQSSCRATVGDDECELYSLCEQLVTDDGVEVNNAVELKENEFDVGHICTSKVNEDTDLYDACKGLCIENRACCFDKPSYSCYEMEKEWCDEYKACEKTNLKFSGGLAGGGSISNSNGGTSGESNTSSTTPAEIEKAVFDACYFDNDESRVTQALVTKCNNICQPRYCCFDSYRLESSCRATVGENQCELYSLCEQMITKDGGVVKTFIELDMKEFDDDGVDPGESNSDELIEKEVFDACYFDNDESRVTQALVTKCNNICQPRYCCFDSYRLESSCRATVGENECELFALCEQMITKDGGVVKTFIELDMKEFDDDGVDPGESNSDELIEKEVFDACYFDNDESRVTQELVTKCNNVCRSRLCCFDSYRLESSCRATVGENECELFALCEQMITKDGGVVKDFIELDLKEFDDDAKLIEKEVFDACYFDNDESRVTQELVTKCNKVCQSRLCCFDSYRLESSCRATVGENQCELFALCEQMITKDGGVVKDFIELDLKEFDDDASNGESNSEQLIEKEVFDACYFDNDESRVTQELVTKCNKVCRSRLCCFDSYRLESSCRATVGENQCELFALCEQMITKDGGVVKDFIELDLKEFDDDASNGESNSEQLIEKEVFDACYFDNDESRVTQELVTKCNKVCRSRLCCFDSYRLESSCRATVGEDECELFALCEQMITKDGGVVKTFIELDLKEFDDDASNGNSASGPGSTVHIQVEILVRLREMKLTLSPLRLKTHSKLADQNCSGRIPAGCSAYEPCKKLVVPPAGTELVASQTTLSTRVETEKRVYDACYFGDDPTKVTEELVTKCHGVCAQRLCCFSDYILQSSCRDTVGDDECELYSLCEQLVTESGVANDALEVEEKEFSVDELCIDKVASDENLYYACRETCEKRSCCFESNPTYSCYDLEKDWCDEYKACAVAEYKFYDEGSSDKDSLDINAVGLVGSSSSSEHDLYVSIDSVCSVDNLRTLEGIEQCFNKCQSYLCCFPEDAAEMGWDCEGFREEECSAYGNCETLVATHNLWKPPSKAANKYAVKIAVNDACILSGGVEPTEEWVSNCHQKCESRMCCLVDPSIRSSCQGAEDSYWRRFQGSGDIEDACSNVNDANSFAKCEAKCKSRQCCFEDVYQFSCYHLEKEWCDEYEICDMVGLTPSSSSNALPSPGAQISAPSPSQSSSQTTISAPTPSITPGVPNNYGSGHRSFRAP
ncbi:hypothetical protein QTG54_014587 [Skeletonema marinoi]|uniref:Uncharacterized protein n=1 Tax=Skeletonema marinoi TaxID=267567 RepID=A0AAD9D6G8_9STRA|nr:hypothetical protein QTG54_014587 [Skeletonema marinoi]